MNISPEQKAHVLGGVTGKFYQTFKAELLPALSNILQKLETVKTSLSQELCQC